jgi:hypothetical protein
VNIPNVGSKVRVTTRFPNYYIYTYKDQPFVDDTYEGTVLPFQKGDKPGTFNMTGDKLMRSRNIAMSRVIKIEYLKGKSVKSDVRSFVVKSKEKSYIVTIVGKRAECSCLGFQYRHKCKHSDAVLKKVA